MEQETLAKSVAEKIPYEFMRYFLVKPLPVEKIKKEFDVPVAKDKKTDENGIEAEDFDEVAKEVKEVDSDYMKGIVLKVPYDYAHQLENSEDKYRPMEIKVGDTLIFRRSKAYFDLIKDTMTVASFDIMAVQKTSGDN